MNILLIGEGADGSKDSLDVKIALKIIHEAQETLKFVITTSNDLQNLLLDEFGWKVSPHIHAPVISSTTGEDVFFVVLVAPSSSSKPASSSTKITKNIDTLRDLLCISGMSENAKLLLDMHGNEHASDRPATEITDQIVHEVSSSSIGSESRKKARTSSLPIDPTDADDLINDNILRLTWQFKVLRKYFNPAAESTGFAKPVSPSQVLNVRETLKRLKSAPLFGFKDGNKKEFEAAMNSWFIEDDSEDFPGWYNDINIEFLTKIVNLAINGGPEASNCVMLGPYFLMVEPMAYKRQWKKMYPKNDFPLITKLLVPAHVTVGQGSTVKNHFIIFDVDVPGCTITVFDSHPPETDAEAVERYKEFEVKITVFIRVMQGKGSLRGWKPVVTLDEDGFIQRNCSDCGVVTCLNGLYIGMGRCADEIKTDFRGDSEMMRLFLASLFLDLTKEGMPPPPPRTPNVFLGQASANKVNETVPPPSPRTPTALPGQAKARTVTEGKPSSPLRTSLASFGQVPPDPPSAIREQPMRQAKIKDEISSGLHLRIEGISASVLGSGNISSMEKDLILNGHAPLGIQFDFTEADLDEVREFYQVNQNEIMKINNTLQDLEASKIDKSSVGKGKLAPRSMIDCSKHTPGYHLGVIQKILKGLKESPELTWLTKTRPNWSFKLLRSLPETSAQYWHRDYCFENSGVDSMFWHAVPLFMITAIEHNTELDFPLGKTEIPRGTSEVGRGDQMHRGAENNTVTAHYRVFMALDSHDSTQFRMNSDGEDTIEPASVEDQKRYDVLYLTNTFAAKPSLVRQKRK
jgi:hypothetical protein